MWIGGNQEPKSLRTATTAAGKVIGAAALTCWAVAVILRLAGNAHRGLQIDLLYAGTYTVVAGMIVIYIGMTLRANAVDQRSLEDFAPLAAELGLSYAECRREHSGSRMGPRGRLLKSGHALLQSMPIS